MDNQTPINPQTASDCAYVEAFRRGDNNLLEELYVACREALTAGLIVDERVSEDEKKDLMQTAFLELWQQAEHGVLYCNNGQLWLKRKDGQEPRLVQSLIAYFLGIADNKSKEQLRFNARFDNLGDSDPLDNSVQAWEADTDGLRDKLVTDCLLQMPPRCKEILTMFYAEHKSLDEILAQRIANKGELLSYDGLKTAKSKCLKQLKTNIQAACQRAGITPPQN